MVIILKKVNTEYLIPIEEFCALDYNNDRQYFLKNIRPDIHKEINSCYEKAMDIANINGKYPEMFIKNTKDDILGKNNLPGYIPIRITKKYTEKKCFVCEDLFSNNKFIIPSNITKVDFNLIYRFYLDLNPNTEINVLLDMYAKSLNPPRKVKRMLKTKDTK